MGLDLITLTGDAAQKYPSYVVDIDDDGKTNVYQVYRLKPKYIVDYYLEVEAGTAARVYFRNYGIPQRGYAYTWQYRK